MMRDLIPHSAKGGCAMILFPAMMVGGHLLITLVDQVPALNFEPICRDPAGQSLWLKDDTAVCIDDEKTARDVLTKRWSEFDSADRTRCVRMSTQDRTASYVEVLTCLEMEQSAKKLHLGRDDITRSIGEPGSAAPARENAKPPAPAVRQARRPAPARPSDPPLALEPPASRSGFPQVLCLPGLKAIISGCEPSAGR
jgi:hypothetical protein